MANNEANEVQIVMPVHNEGESIAATLREWHSTVSPIAAMQLVVVEDGSTDNTKKVLAECSQTLPMLLNTETARRCYANAVTTALQLTTAPYVLAVDADGQCDPADFQHFWNQRDRANILIGWRVRRIDSLARKLISFTFGMLYRRLFEVEIHDPSCPYLLFRRQVYEAMPPELGLLTEGFWWEFIARANNLGYSIMELPINHRQRLSGESVIYQPKSMSRIATRNLRGLFKLWKQIRKHS